MYDIIVIGGGIAGLYTTYKIHKKSPQTKVLLIEKENRLGGRVHTFENKHMTVEAGAGRIHGSQPLIMGLIGELGLTTKLIKNSGSVVYRPANSNSETESSSSDAPKNHTLLEPVYNYLVDSIFGPKTLPITGLILTLVAVSKTYSKQYLQNHTLSQFAERVLTKDQVNYIKGSFGYYSEFVIMNAYDAIKLLNELSPSNTFYSMKGGLDQIVDKMVTSIKRNPNIDILLQKEVSKIVYKESNSSSDLRSLTELVVQRLSAPFPESVFDVYVDHTRYTCKQCICALPKPALLKLSIFTPIRPLLHKVECGTLCRIYSKFDKENLWFKDIDKFTTNNDLRMVIPYKPQEGVIMISYSDNIFADRWQRLYKKEGIRAVNTKLRKDMLESTGIMIPMPKHTEIFYWDCGVGYWGVGADSNKVAEKMIQPYKKVNLFICGENYSENGQQWIEGALETADKVLSVLQLMSPLRSRHPYETLPSNGRTSFRLIP
jgi:monoamine oxidase